MSISYIICDLLEPLATPGQVTSVTPVPGPYDSAKIPTSGDIFDGVIRTFTIPKIQRITFKKNKYNVDAYYQFPKYFFKNEVLLKENIDYTTDSSFEYVTFTVAPISSDIIYVVDMPDGPMWYIPLDPKVYTVTSLYNTNIGRVTINANYSRLEPGMGKLRIRYEDHEHINREHNYNIPFWDGESIKSDEHRLTADDLNDIIFYFVNRILEDIDDRGFYTIVRNGNMDVIRIDRVYTSFNGDTHLEKLSIDRDAEDFVKTIQQNVDNINIEHAYFVREAEGFVNIIPPLTGVAISGGDDTGWGCNPSDAFNGNWWKPSQVGYPNINNAWIGYDFGVNNAKSITAVRWKTREPGYNLNGILLQKSNDGVNWSTVIDWFFTYYQEEWVLRNAPYTSPARYWRLRGNYDGSDPSISWALGCLEMTELLVDICASNSIAPVSKGDLPLPLSLAEYAFDGTTGTAWRAFQPGEAMDWRAYIGCDFGEGNEKNITSLQFYSPYADVNLPFVVCISSDGSFWGQVTEKITSSLNPYYHYFRFDNNYYARYWNIYAVDNVLGLPHWTVNELNMYQSFNNLCTVYYGIHAFSNGDYVGYPKENAFDNNPSTYWYSAFQGGNTAYNAYIGFDFGVGNEKEIRHIKITNPPDINNIVESIKIQNGNGVSYWYDVATIYPLKVANGTMYFYLPRSSKQRYWRLLANSNLTDSYRWGINKIEMTDYIPSFALTKYIGLDTDI